MQWPYFDTAAYLDNNPDVRQAGADPFAHYSEHGWREGRDASTYLDTQWYARTYLNQDGAVDPVTHYLNGGWQQGCRPNPLFDPAWYLRTYVDVAEAGVEPLSHYVNWGWREGRQPSIYFDVNFYLHQNADVAQSGGEALGHYLRFGWREEHRQPNPLFQPRWYHAQPGAPAPADGCALCHYVQIGAGQGLAPGPGFDPAFYLSTYPDVAGWGEALAHYLEIGRHERRQPHSKALPAPDADVSAWASANALNARRASLLESSLNMTLRQPNAATIAKAMLRRALIGIDVVTFDVFDTLVERRSGRPETIFALMAQGSRGLGLRAGELADLRRQGENAARAAAGLREVTMAEIWDHVARISGLAVSDCAALAEREAALEVAMCEPKAIGLTLFHTALAEGRKVHLLSDIYLDRTTLEAILIKAGVDGYHQLYISSEIGGTKHHGGMFKLLLAEQALAPEKVLHIGDNPHSDIAMPRSLGMRAMQIYRSDIMTASPALQSWFGSDCSTSDGIWRAIVAGELVHQEANMSAAGPDLMEQIRFAGARALGPVLLGFSQYLGWKAQQFGHNQLFFAARDGFYLREAYELLRAAQPDLPPSRYILASRRVCQAAGIANLNDIMAVAAVDHFPMTIRNFLTARFLMDPVQIAALPVDSTDLDRIVTHASRDAALRRVLEQAKTQILARCARHASAYRDYLLASNIGEPGAALVDIGYRGTTQTAISKMIGSRIDGLYLVTWPEVNRLLIRGLRHDAFVATDGAVDMPFIRYVQLLELLCSATHGSVSAFEPAPEGGRPVMILSDIAARTGHTLNALREGALAFVRETIAAQPDLLRQRPPSGPASLDTFVELCTQPPREVVEGLSEHVFEDLFGGAVKPLIGSVDGPLSEALVSGCWPEGTMALRRVRGFGQGTLVWPAAPAALDSFDQAGRTIPAFRQQPQDVLA